MTVLGEQWYFRLQTSKDFDFTVIQNAEEQGYKYQTERCHNLLISNSQDYRVHEKIRRFLLCVTNTQRYNILFSLSRLLENISQVPKQVTTFVHSLYKIFLNVYPEVYQVSHCSTRLQTPLFTPVRSPTAARSFTSRTARRATSCSSLHKKVLSTGTFFTYKLVTFFYFWFSFFL